MIPTASFSACIFIIPGSEGATQLAQAVFFLLGLTDATGTEEAVVAAITIVNIFITGMVVMNMLAVESCGPSFVAFGFAIAARAEECCYMGASG